MKQAKLSYHSDYDITVLHKRPLFQNFQLQNVAIRDKSYSFETLSTFVSKI